MPNNREQALVEYQKQFGTVLNCVAYAWVSSYPVSSDEYMLVSNNRSGPKTPLLTMKKGKENYSLEASQRIKIVDSENFRITTVKYFYIIWHHRPNERIIDWHYHKRQNNSFEAHLHIRDDAQITNHYLVDKHLPTGRVPIEDVIRFAIEETGITPRATNWKALLNQTETVFQKNRTW